MRKKIAPKVHPVRYEDPLTLKRDPSNPRKIDKRELERLATNIAKYGFVEAVTACLETNELVGGHQRVEALGMLIRGEFVPTERVLVKGEWATRPIAHDWHAEKEPKIPVIYVEGMGKQELRKLNVSLNRIGGEWDYDKLVHNIAEMYEAEVAMLTPLMESVDPTDGIQALLDTGFTAAELADYIDLKGNPEPGMTPERTTGTPKLTLEFSTKELRDAFKAYVADGKDETLPSGDAVAKKLNVSTIPARKRATA